MARPRIIEEETMLKLMREAFKQSSFSTREFSYRYAAEYINSHGYPDVKSSLLRNTPKAAELYRQLKEEERTSTERLTFAYKTFDIDAFLDRHRTRERLKEGLMQREQYVRDLYDIYACLLRRLQELMEENEKQRLKLKNLGAETKEGKLEAEETAAKLDTMRKERNAARDECLALRKLVDTYLYPEIANELLKKSGLLLNTGRIVDPEAAGQNLVTEKTKVRSDSTIVKGMFGKFGGNES